MWITQELVAIWIKFFYTEWQNKLIGDYEQIVFLIWIISNKYLK